MQTQPAASRTPRHLLRAMEACWLIALVLVPLVIMPEGFMQGFIQVPKVFVLRTVAFVLVVLLALEWTLQPGKPTLAGLRAFPRSAWVAINASAARWIILAALGVAGANLVTFVFAPVKSISAFGIDSGWDTYALVNVGSYLVVFTVMLRHLRTREQLVRVLWGLTIVTQLASLIAFAQHFGVDPFRTAPVPEDRAPGTFGNPIFLGSVLVMTVPLAIALFLSYRERMSLPAQLWIGGLLLALPGAAIVFSLSRGPWVASMVAAVVFLGLLWRQYGKGLAGKLVGIGAVAVVVVGVFIMLPVQETGRSGFNAVGYRVEGFAQTAGGLGNRLITWRTAAKVYFTVPWVDTEEYPEIPPISPRFLRPLVGFGQDMFGYAYPMAGESTYTFELASHGHNFLVHTALELGLLGVGAYVALIIALALALVRLLREAAPGKAPDWYRLLLIGLSAALAGRIVEQIPGKAQVSDLLLSWALAALIGVLAIVRFASAPTIEQAPPASSTPQRRQNRYRSARTAAAEGPAPLRLAGLGVIGLVALVLWFVIVWSPLAASVNSGAVDTLEQRMAVAQQSGDIAGLVSARDAIIDVKERSVGLDGGSALSRMGVAQGLFDRGLLENDVRTKLSLFSQAYRWALSVLERNPLDHRAWSRAAEFHRELGALRDEPAITSARETLVLSRLLPGFWQAHTGLAWSYARRGEFEAALPPVEVARELIGSQPDNTELAFYYYTRAITMQGLGRDEEAITAAQHAFRLQPVSFVLDLLHELGASPL
jgi:O-antigen ligase